MTIFNLGFNIFFLVLLHSNSSGSKICNDYYIVCLFKWVYWMWWIMVQIYIPRQVKIMWQ